MLRRRRHTTNAIAHIESIATDITRINADVIVNAANEQLAAGGGVCGAIFAAAGHRRLQAACNEIGCCATGDAVTTPSFNLAEHGISHIVHAVGPRWHAHSPDQADALLAAAYRSALNEAVAVGARSIAIPGISTGIFGFPMDRAAEVVARVLTTESFDLDRITLVTLRADGAAVYAAALDAARAAGEER